MHDRAEMNIVMNGLMSCNHMDTHTLQYSAHITVQYTLYASVWNTDWIKWLEKRKQKEQVWIVNMYSHYNNGRIPFVVNDILHMCNDSIKMKDVDYDMCKD